MDNRKKTINISARDSYSNNITDTQANVSSLSKRFKTIKVSKIATARRASNVIESKPGNLNE